MPGECSGAAARSGDHQPLGVEHPYRRAGLRSVTAGCRFGDLDPPVRVRFAVGCAADGPSAADHQVEIDLLCRPLQILGPQVVFRTRPAAIHPLRVGAAFDEEGRPAECPHPVVDLGVVAADRRRMVGETEVLLRAGAQPVPSVGPSAVLEPVAAHRGCLYDGDPGGGQAGRPEGVCFGGHRDGLGAGADDDQPIGRRRGAHPATTGLGDAATGGAQYTVASNRLCGKSGSGI